MADTNECNTYIATSDASSNSASIYVGGILVNGVTDIDIHKMEPNCIVQATITVECILGKPPELEDK